MNIISMNMDYKLFPIMARIDKLDLGHAALTLSDRVLCKRLSDFIASFPKSTSPDILDKLRHPKIFQLLPPSGWLTLPSTSSVKCMSEHYWQIRHCIVSYLIFAFYPRDAMLARVIAIATCLSVRLSVRLSRASIVSKRRKLASWFLHHLVAPRL